MSAWVWMMGMWIRIRVPAPLGPLIFDVSGTWSMGPKLWRPLHSSWHASPAPNASHRAAGLPRAPPPESRPASRTAGRPHHNIYATEPEYPQYLGDGRLRNPRGLLASPSGYRQVMGSAFTISTGALASASAGGSGSCASPGRSRGGERRKRGGGGRQAARPDQLAERVWNPAPGDDPRAHGGAEAAAPG